MAMIDTVVSRQFNSRSLEEDGLSHFDRCIHSVAIGLRMIRDMALHGSPGSTGSDPDPEELAVLAEALIAQLGHLGPIVDQLEQRQSGNIRK